MGALHAHQSPASLRNLFVTLMIFNNIAEPLKLWETFKHDMSDDLLHQSHLTPYNAQLPALAADTDMALSAIAAILQIHRQT